MTIFKHQFFDSKQVFPLIQDIIKRVPNYHMLLKLHQPKHKPYEIKPLAQGQYDNIFERSFNYLNPTFELEQKIGPKFNSSF